MTVSAYAPGRVELLGNHTDYNQGLVLAAAIDRGINVTGTARDDDLIILRSTDHGDVTLSDLPPPERHWSSYPIGVVYELRRAGHSVAGFEANVAGDLPSGIGLASSAALEVATAGFLMKLHGLRLAPLEVAKLCQRAENEFVGVRSGLLDQVTSVFGRKDHLVFLDFRTEEVRTIPFPAEFALVIADSGAKHQLLASQYNTRREECVAAAEALGVSSLREIDPSRLVSACGSLDPLLYKRATHIVGENKRVRRALEALRSGDAAAVGQLMNASHESSRINFENSTAALDSLVEIARAVPGVLGSRLTGGGFGGATVTLVETSRANELIRTLRAKYRRRAAETPTIFACQIADGAAVSWTNP